MRALYNLLLALNLITLAVFPSAQSAGAQSLPPSVTMTEAGIVNVGDRPMLAISVSVIEQDVAAWGAFRGNLTTADWEVTEDGAPVTGLTVNTETVGWAVVIVLDSGAYVKSKGVTGTRWDDARDLAKDQRDKNGLVSELVDFRLTPVDLSGLVGVARIITSVVELGYDPVKVSNQAYLMIPYDRATPLHDGISEALKLFQPPAPASVSTMRKSIIVLSDGIDIASHKNEITDLIDKAQKQGVNIYTIGMDSPDGSGRFDPAGLERLAEQTGGVFIHHKTRQDREQALALFDRLATQRNQYKLMYPTRAAEGTHQVCAKLRNVPGQPAQCKDFFSSLRLPRLEITPSKSGVVQGKEKTLITPKWEPMDGYKRDPKKIAYLIDGKVITETVAPFKFEWDGSNVAEGEHTIEARLYDSILPDTSYSVSNAVKVKVTVAAPEKITMEVGRQWLSLLLIPIVIVLIILMVLMRKQISKSVRATTSRLRAATQFLTKSKYKLVIVRGPSAGQEFWLNKQRMRIGRDESAEIPLLTDPHVSGLHAELTEDQLGFSIADLTSANGTFVNGQRLGSGQQKGQAGPPMLLQPGYIIRAGGTEMRLDRVGGTTRVLGP